MKTLAETTSLRNYSRGESFDVHKKIADCLTTYLEDTGNTVMMLDLRVPSYEKGHKISFQVNNIRTRKGDEVAIAGKLEMIEFGGMLIPAIYFPCTFLVHGDEVIDRRISQTTLPLDAKWKDIIESLTGLPFIVGAQLFKCDAKTPICPPVISPLDAVAAAYALTIEELTHQMVGDSNLDNATIWKIARDLVIYDLDKLEKKVYGNFNALYKDFYRYRSKRSVRYIVQRYCKNIQLQVLFPTDREKFERQLTTLREYYG